jgi:hypothetical protein
VKPNTDVIQSKVLVLYPLLIRGLLEEERKINHHIF